MPTLLCHLSGLYKFIVSRDGAIVRETGWQPNLITLAGRDQIGLGDFITQMQVGTGTTEADESDTALETLLGTSNDITSQTTGTGILYEDQPTCYDSGPYGYGRWAFHFAEDAVTGTITEAGAGWGAGLFSRLILEESITVGAGEALDVLFELRNAAMAHGEGGPWNNVHFALGAADYSGRMCAAYITSGDIGQGWGVSGEAVAITDVLAYEDALVVNPEDDYSQICGGPAGDPVAATVVNHDYVPGSYIKTATATFSASTANFATGIKTLLIDTNGIGCFQYQAHDDCLIPDCDPPIYGPILKSSPQVLTLELAVTWSGDMNG